MLLLHAMQVGSLYALYSIPGYQPSLGTPDLRTVVAPETTVIYLIGLSQFIILALIFNKGYPHRKPLWNNYSLMTAMLLQLLFLLYSLFFVDRFTQGIEQLVDRTGLISGSVRVGLLLIMSGAAGLAFLTEALTRYLMHLKDRWSMGRSK